MEPKQNAQTHASLKRTAVVAVDEEEAGMAVAEGNSCESCRFWLSHGDPPDWKLQYGDCRRYPPTVVPGHDADCTEVQWPATERGEWCGEHASRDPLR